ncbi:MAG: DNA integrity scanning diadenylate cyclase DisA [Deltaproteobacteria bacterium]
MDERDNEMMEIIKMIAPGTLLREGLEYILKAKTGALILVADIDDVSSVIDGGFLINKDYNPASIYELAKMDGAIVLSKDAKKIIYANAQLMPDCKIQTVETGTRHRTAERVAKQTGELVICISQRRGLITLFKGNFRYLMKETSVILAGANQALQTLEKYKKVLDSALTNLSINEFYDLVTLEHVALVIQRIEMVLRIVKEIRRYIFELGNEGRLVSMQLEELVGSTEKEGYLIIEDYMFPTENKRPEDVLKQLSMLSNEELIDLNLICKTLGYHGGMASLDLNLTPRGFRIMSKLPKLPMSIIKNLVDKFVNLQGVLKASIEELDDVDGIGEVRAKSIKEGLRRTFDVLNMGTKSIRDDYLMDMPLYFSNKIN